MRFNLALSKDRQAAINYLIDLGYSAILAAKQILILINWTRGGHISIAKDSTITVYHIQRHGQENSLDWSVLNTTI